jgi:hypothetical protein
MKIAIASKSFWRSTLRRHYDSLRLIYVCLIERKKKANKFPFCKLSARMYGVREGYEWVSWDFSFESNRYVLIVG